VTVTDKVEYTVGVPGGAAIMLDKMNVFYIGVDNPITISSGSGWDKTSVSMTGGTLTGSNSNRVVRVSSIGAASITVTADGKSSKFDFRVKRIPDPIFKIGPSSGGGINAAVFKSQQFCRAELENFDFDARFQVVGGTVYFTGAGFPVTQQATITGNNLGALPQLANCRPGTSVIFDNIQVMGPDGTKRTIQAPGFLLK
jgi:GldM C-terminal domain